MDSKDKGQEDSRAKLINPNSREHFYLSSTLIIVILAFSIGCYLFANSTAKNWVPNTETKSLCFEQKGCIDEKIKPGSRSNNSNLENKYIIVTNRSIIRSGNAVLNRLRDQYAMIQEWKKIHLNIIVFYYTFDFVFTWMIAFLGVFAALLSIFISHKGWQAIDPFVLNAFIVVVATSVFYASIPSVFKHKDNIQNNKNMFMKYNQIERQYLSYLATGKQTFNKTTIETPVEYIQYLDHIIQEIEEFPLEMDPNAGPGADEIFRNYLEGGNM